jgi:hypothetical protein
MASATVFVDKAVNGEFPPICVKTGGRADALLKVQKPIGGGGVARWILLLMGPPGWLALAILGGVGGVLTVTLPYSNRAVERYEARRRTMIIACVIGVATLIGAVAGVGSSVLWGIAITALICALVFQVVLVFDEVDIKLDASRRWVTLVGVDERFAKAVEAADRAARDRV